MKSAIFVLIAFTALLSCKNNKVSNAEPIAEIPSEKFYQDSVRIIASNILNGESIWGRNEQYLFPIMDSLISPLPESREFYFKVFSRITEQADGYVSEALGLYVLKYFDFDPEGFLANSRMLSDDVFKSMGHHAGLELFLSSEDNGNKAFLNLDSVVKEKAADLGQPDRDRLQVFLKFIQESIRANQIENADSIPG